MTMEAFAIPARSSYRNGDYAVELYTTSEGGVGCGTDTGAISIGHQRFRRFIVDRECLFRTLPEEYLSAFAFHRVRVRKSPRIMAIVNSTPDSFYPLSRHISADAELDRIIESRPDIIDIGGESTRPGSMPITVEEEIERITPVIDYITSSCSIPVSLDTRHPQVALRFIDRISIINDIGGFTDPEMVRVCSDHGKECIIMHMRGTPADMQQLTRYDDVVAEVSYFLQSRVMSLLAAGIVREKIVVDPGIGFSKDLGGNLSLLKNIESLRFGYPLLVGHSRKSFIGKITGKPVEERLVGTLAVSTYLAQHGVDIIRVHDPAEHRDALKIIQAIEDAV